MDDPGAISRLNTALEGRYRIEGELGEGGMATVYLAEDLKHKRQVAVKVLRPELASAVGPDRFLREIEITARLTHPHILPLLDSGEAEGDLFYVMPYVEGETLRERLDRERELPVEESLAVIKALAGALDYAHRQGVVHRDIKPSNILFQDGQPLIADFGVGVALSAAGGDRLTSTGISVGTPQYMSPEQATVDRPVDGRTDVYALGCVLYEMLAGEPPFAAGSARAILTRKLTDTAPDVAAIRETVPPFSAQAIRRALSRTPADRFATANDFVRALETPAPPPALAMEQGEGRRSRRWPLILALATLTAVAVGAMAWVSSSAEPLPPVYLALPQGPASPAEYLIRPMMDISPNGQWIGYLADDSVGRRLYLKSMAEPAWAVEGSEGAMSPAFSPDGRYLAYYRDGQFWRVDVETGQSVVIAPAEDAILGAAWTDDDRLLFTRGYRSGLTALSVGSGQATEVTSVDPTDSDRLPVALPGSTRLIYYSYVEPTGIWSLDASTGTREFIVQGEAPQYADGHLFYRRRSTLYGQRFDPRAGVLSGDAVPLLTGVGQYAVSETGTLVYGPPRANFTGLVGRLAVVNADGARTEISGGSGIGPSISPDGRRVAAQDDGVPVVYDLRAGSEERLPVRSFYPPIWSPDGQALVYAGGLGELRRYDLASGSEEEIYSSAAGEADIVPIGWTREGGAVFTIAVGDSTDIRVLSADGGVVSIHRLPGQVRTAALSPDGRRIAITRGPSLEDQSVHMSSFPDMRASTAISRPGANSPGWAPDGRSVYFLEGEDLVQVTVGGPGEPTPLERRTVLSTVRNRIGLRAFDVFPDGERFVFSLPVSTGPSQVVVVTGWLDSVRGQMRE